MPKPKCLKSGVPKVPKIITLNFIRQTYGGLSSL